MTPTNEKESIDENKKKLKLSAFIALGKIGINLILDLIFSHLDQ